MVYKYNLLPIYTLLLRNIVGNIYFQLNFIRSRDGPEKYVHVKKAEMKENKKTTLRRYKPHEACYTTSAKIHSSCRIDVDARMHDLRYFL